VSARIAVNVTELRSLTTEVTAADLVQGDLVVFVARLAGYHLDHELPVYRFDGVTCRSVADGTEVVIDEQMFRTMRLTT
jgi:hypothetical protein